MEKNTVKLRDRKKAGIVTKPLDFGVTIEGADPASLLHRIAIRSSSQSSQSEVSPLHNDFGGTYRYTWTTLVYNFIMGVCKEHFESGKSPLLFQPDVGLFTRYCRLVSS
jgi:hypothetical protein